MLDISIPTGGCWNPHACKTSTSLSCRHTPKMHQNPPKSKVYRESDNIVTMMINHWIGGYPVFKQLDTCQTKLGTKEIVEVDGAFVCPGLQDVVNICGIPKPNVLLTERLQKLPWRQNRQSIWNFTETLQSLVTTVCNIGLYVAIMFLLFIIDHLAALPFHQVLSKYIYMCLWQHFLCGPLLGESWGKSALNTKHKNESNHWGLTTRMSVLPWLISFHCCCSWTWVFSPVSSNT